MSRVVDVLLFLLIVQWFRKRWPFAPAPDARPAEPAPPPEPPPVDDPFAAQPPDDRPHP